MTNYHRLVAWQKAYFLAQEVYEFSTHLPDSERYGLSSQLKRAAVSVVANIAEASGRGSDADFCRILWIARGSSTELVTELSLCRDMNLISVEKANPTIELANEVGRVITGLLKARGAYSRKSPPLKPNTQSLKPNA